MESKAEITAERGGAKYVQGASRTKFARTGSIKFESVKRIAIIRECHCVYFHVFYF